MSCVRVKEQWAVDNAEDGVSGLRNILCLDLCTFRRFSRSVSVLFRFPFSQFLFSGYFYDGLNFILFLLSTDFLYFENIDWVPGWYKQRLPTTPFFLAGLWNRNYFLRAASLTQRATAWSMRDAVHAWCVPWVVWSICVGWRYVGIG